MKLVNSFQHRPPPRPAQTSSGIYLPVKEILVDLKAESTDLIESQGKGQWSLYQDVEHKLSLWFLKNKVPVSIYCVWDQLIFFLQRFLSGKTNNHNWHFEPDLRIKIPFWNLWNLVREREREERRKTGKENPTHTTLSL